MRTSENIDAKRMYFSEHVTSAMRCIPQYPLTVVEAPMGYGKTTAVRETLHKLNAKVLWQNVYGDGPQDFWQGFCEVLFKLDAGLSESLRSMGLPPDSTLRREAVNLLRSLTVSQLTFLIIDDYHLVRSSLADDFLKIMLRDLPEWLHVIIITRSAFFLDTAESRLKGFVNHIGMEQLEFSASDIAKYYRLCGFAITEDEQNLLYSRSEGWVSALYLFMLEYIADGCIAGTGNIQELVRQTVYSPLSAEQKDFLNCIGLLDSFDLQQAKYLWQKENAETLLEELLSRNAFITRGRFSSGYHLHNIFSVCVREEFEKLPDERQREIRRRIGSWHMIKKEYLQAMDCFYRSKSFDDLLNALEIDKGNSLSGETIHRIIGYITDCPNEILSHRHFAMLVYARKLFAVNEMQLFGQTCYALLKNIAVDNELSREEKDNLLGEYELLMSFTKYNDIQKMSEHHQKASGLMKTTTKILDVHSNWTFASPSVLAMFYRETGRLSDEVSIMKKSMPFYYQITNNHGYGAEFIMEAEADFCRGKIEKSEVALYKAVYQATSAMQWSILFCTSFLQCRLAVFQGDYLAALKRMEQTRSQIVENKLFVFFHTVDICETYIYALLGQPQKFADWLTHGEITNTKLLFPAMPMLYTVYGRVLLEQGEYKKLIGLSDLFLKTASVFPNLLCKVYIYIHLASAYNKIFNRDKAVESLVSALEIAAPDELFMPFVENGEYLGIILWDSGLFTEYAKFTAECRTLYAVYACAIEKIRHEYFDDIHAALTFREREVAELAAQGMSNKEIGQQLFITENTVKARLKSVFEKLKIKSRAQLAEHLAK